MKTSHRTTVLIALLVAALLAAAWHIVTSNNAAMHGAQRGLPAGVMH